MSFAHTDRVKAHGERLQSFAGAPAVNSVTEGFCNKHLHFQNILSKRHYCAFIVLAILGFSDFYFLFLLWQNISNDKIDYTFLYKKNFVKTRGSFLLKIE